jgi:hypothetical protein
MRDGEEGAKLVRGLKKWYRYDGIFQDLPGSRGWMES